MAPNPTAAPILFDRALLRARQDRALRGGPATFLLDRVAEDMAERLQAVLREFKDAADFGRAVEWPQHRLQPLRHVLGDPVEQERRRPSAPGAVLPRPQQRAIEQDGGCIGVGGHAAWYADPSISGNPRLASAARVLRVGGGNGALGAKKMNPNRV